MDNMRDLEYIQSMYPDRMKVIQKHVSGACDKMEYKHSPMYDEYPDRVTINQICGSICEQIMKETDLSTQLDLAVTVENTGVEEIETYEMASTQQLPNRGGPQGRPPQGRPPWGPPPWGPPPGPPPWGPPPGPPPSPPPGPPPRPPVGPPPWGPPPGPPPWGPPPGPPPRPHPRPPQGPNWLDDVVRIMFLNEMYNRRCRRGNC